MRLCLRSKTVEKAAPLLMGIVNVTPDSFSDGGKFFSGEQAFAQALRLQREGADIIDVGGESTRPGAKRVGVDEEIARVVPVITRIKKELDLLVSVDTYKAEVARCAVAEAGADMVNDISALAFSPEMAETVARLQVPVILMHIKGTPQDMQVDPGYADVIGEIAGYFTERIGFAQQKGINRERIMIDPGIGFGKRLEDNIQIVRHLERFTCFGLPIVIGLSRKSFLGKLSGETTPENRRAESLAANIVAVLKGAALIRVHEVLPLVAALKVLKELADIPVS